MAYQPIVLGSNLVSDGNIGALPGLTYSNSDEDRTAVVTNEDGTITVPTYQLASNTPTFDLQNMQNIYGTKYMPMFRWISQKQTGSVTFDPEEGQISEEEAERLISEFESETGMTAAEAMKQEAIGVGSQLAAGIGGQIGRSIASNVGDGGFELGDISKGFSDFGSNFELKDVFGAPKTGPAAKIEYSPNTARGKIAAEDAIIKSATATPKEIKAAKDARAAIQTDNPDSLGYVAGFKDRLNSGKGSAAGKANLYGAAGAGLGTIAANLIAGRSLKESVQSGVKVGAGTYIGTLIGGGFGGMIGGLLGGRVICNELMRQKIMTRKQVAMDYKFTEDYLTPQHVAGYHIWAVWMVRQMRKGRLVNFWKHVAGHRANEIAYIYGERDKPDYLGKVYRKILEPICWSIGFFCQKTDWTVLYKEKEI